MALIRTKRATTAGQNGGPGQPKSKYRKRSVGRASLHMLLSERVLTFCLFLFSLACDPARKVSFM